MTSNGSKIEKQNKFNALLLCNCMKQILKLWHVFVARFAPRWNKALALDIWFNKITKQNFKSYVDQFTAS